MPRPHVILEHRKSAKAEGRSLLREVVVTNIVMAVFGCLILPLFCWWLGLSDASLSVFVIGSLLIQAAITVLLVSLAIPHLKSNDLFVCRLDEKEFVCTVPPVNVLGSLSSGESFSIRLADITKLEESRDGDAINHTTWIIHTKSGQRFWLTSNYENPVEQFVEAIEERFHDLVVIRV
jgi:hypothetical protein